jgi:hypothetical protein
LENIPENISWNLLENLPENILEIFSKTFRKCFGEQAGEPSINISEKFRIICWKKNYREISITTKISLAGEFALAHFTRVE